MRPLPTDPIRREMVGEARFAVHPGDAPLLRLFERLFPHIEPFFSERVRAHHLMKIGAALELKRRHVPRRFVPLNPFFPNHPRPLPFVLFCFRYAAASSSLTSIVRTVARWRRASSRKRRPPHPSPPLIRRHAMLANNKDGRLLWQTATAAASGKVGDNGGRHAGETAKRRRLLARFQAALRRKHRGSCIP